MRQNLHTHSTYCDGCNPPEVMVLAAIEKRFDILGFSGHGPVKDPYAMSIEGLRSYVKEINELKKKLDGPSKAHQAYLQQKEEYEKNKKKIEGDESIPNSLIWLKKEKEYIENQLTHVLQEKVNARNTISK